MLTTTNINHVNNNNQRHNPNHNKLIFKLLLMSWRGYIVECQTLENLCA